MYRIKVAIICAFIFGILASVSAQQLPTNHNRMLFAYDLMSSTTDIGTVTNTSGTFLPGQGWRPNSISSGRLEIQLNNYLPYEGTAEVKITGLSASIVKNDWVPFSIWSRKEQRFYLPDGSGNPSEGAFAMIKTDEKKVSGNTVYFKFITKSFFDPIKDNYYTTDTGPIAFDASKVYTFRLVWVPGMIWLQIYEGSTKLTECSTRFSCQSEAFSYISIGKNKEYQSMTGVIYRDLIVKVPTTSIFFRDITKSSGAAFDSTTDCQGIAISDFNNDQKEDVFLSMSSANDRLFIAGDNGLIFTEAAGAYGLGVKSGAFSAVTGDFTNDGKVDLFVTAYGFPNRLYINKTGGLFENESGSRGIDTGNSTAPNSLVFDLENDGDLDIYVCNTGVVHTIYVNQGNGNFTKRDLTSIAPIGSGTRGVAGDVNGDGYVDVFYPRRNANCVMLINNKAGSFTDEASSRGLAFNTDPYGSTLADLDNDGDLDLILAVASLAGDGKPQVAIYQNDGTGKFTKVVSYFVECYGVAVGDVDNDGKQDLFLMRRYKYSSDFYDYSADLYRNTSSGTSISFSLQKGTGANNIFVDGRACAMADFNNDGKLDIYAAAKGMISSNSKPYGRNALLLNLTENSNNYIKIRLLDQHGLIAGYGSKIRVFKQGYLGQMGYLLGHREVMSQQGYQSMPSLIQHFGVGTEAFVDIEVRSTNGKTFTYTNIPVNQTLTINPFQVDPKTLQKVKGDNQTAAAGTAVADSITVRVLDVDDRPLLGYNVSFSITQGGGTLNGTGANITVATDQYGLARVKWTLGATVGTNTLEVTALKGSDHITGSPMIFTATASSGAASRMIKLSGDGQMGYAGDPLQNPIVVKVTDVNNNPINGYPVTFAVAQGGGGLGASGTAQQLEVVTTVDGTAQTIWRLGMTEGLQKVNAYGAFNVNDPVVFSATAQAPQRRLTYESGDRQIGTVNQTTSAPLRVILKDHLGVPVVGGTVQFAVIAGGGKINGQTTVNATTGTDGIAAVTPTLGTVAGDTNNVFQATSAGAQGTVTFKISARPAAAAQLIEVSGNNRTGKVGRMLANPFVVRVVDAFNNGISGFQVDFSVATGGGSINSQSSARVSADINGYASAYLRLGTTAGINTVIVSAAGLSGSPITFTAVGEASSPALMYKISGDGQKGSLGQPLPLPLVVAVNDSFSNAIVNHPVTFRVTKGNGTVDGQNSVTVTTNQLGRASVNFTLGTESFQNEITVVSQYLGMDIPTYPSPLVFTATTAPGDPRNLVYISGNYQIGAYNSDLPQPFKVQVTDYLGVPIANHEVIFYAISPGASFSGATRVVKRTDENGYAQVTATVGSEYGTNNNIYEARAEFQGVPLNNSPVQFFASSRLSTATRMIYVYGNNLTGTVGEFLIDSLKVKAVDAQDNPVANHPITFEVLPGTIPAYLNGQYNTLVVPTGANGIAKVAVKLGAVPGRVQVRATTTDGRVDLLGSPIDFELTAQIGAPSASRSTLTATSPVIANGQETSKILVTVRDSQGNPVPGKIVGIFTSGLEVKVTQPVMATDANGQAQGSISATRTGKVKVWTKVDNVHIPHDTVEVTFIAGPPTRAVSFGSGQIALRGRALPMPVGVYLYDANNNAVPNVPVSFFVKSGGGSIPQPQPMQTDENGRAQVNWILGSKIGEQYLSAVVPQLGSSEIQFWAIATPPAPATMDIVRGNLQIGIINTAMPDSFVVAVRDSTGAPAEGLAVYFSLVRGQGTFLSPNPVTTDKRGYAAVLFRPSTTAGEYGVLATLAAGLSVEFKFIIQLEPTVFLSKVKDAKENIRPREKQSLEVLVNDAWGRPVSGQAVKFEVLEGGGTLGSAMPINSNHVGKVSVEWTAGQKGLQKVKASPMGKAGAMLLFTSMVVNEAPTLTVPAQKKVMAGELLTFSVSAYDADGDTIKLGVRGLPAGASFDSTVTRLFSWTPTRTQANRNYIVKFIASDQYGAADTAQVTIVVEAYNQAPTIDSYEPADTTVTHYYNKPITFKVFASDIDNDPLQYEWWINDLFAGSQPILVFQPEPEYFPRDNIVLVKVSDGKVTVSLRWHIHLQIPDAVRLSLFEALPQKSGVLLKWRTAAEYDNLGFHVLRSTSASGNYQTITTTPILSNPEGEYSYWDREVEGGKKYYYMIQDIDRDGKATPHGPIVAEVPLPTAVSLSQNYPNPFNPFTTIRFELPQPDEIELSVFNVTGQRIRCLIKGQKAAGLHQVVWNGRDEHGEPVPSGIYYYRLVTTHKVFSKKLVLAK